MPEEFLHELGMHALLEEKRGARVPEVVEAGLLWEPGALEETAVRAADQGLGAHGLAAVAGEEEAVIFPERTDP